MRYMLTLLIFVTSTAFAQKQIVIGQTWEIAEPDPIELAKERARNIDPARLTPKHSYRTRLAAKAVYRVYEPKTRIVVPSFTLDKTIYDKDGGVLYPAGFEFNFLEYTPFRSQRIVVIDESDAEHITSWLKSDDIVIVRDGDLDAVSNTLERHATMLDKLTAERLELRRVPVLIYREDNHFVHQEFLPTEGAPL